MSYVSLSNSSSEYLPLFVVVYLIWMYVCIYGCMYVLMYSCESARQVFRYWFRSKADVIWSQPNEQNSIQNQRNLNIINLSVLQLITRTIPTTSDPGKIWHVTNSSWRRRQRQQWTLAAMAAERRRSCAAAPVRRFTVSKLVTVTKYICLHVHIRRIYCTSSAEHFRN